MQYVLKPTKIFLEQVRELSPPARKVLDEKINTLKSSPYHYKRLRGLSLPLFRIRFSDNRNDKRLVYLVQPPFIELLCILDRKHDYKDLCRYLHRLGIR